MLAKGVYMIFPFLLFFLTGAASYGAVPSLLADCNFKAFGEQRLSAERESFWVRTPEYEHHDLTAERLYDQALVQQISQCYQAFLKTDFPSCKFNEARPEAATLHKEGNFYWGFVDQGARASFSSLALSYTKQLLGQITTCFQREHLAGINHQGFSFIAGALDRMSRLTDEHYNSLGLVPYGTVETTCRGCGVRDGDPETTTIVSFHGFRLKEIESDDQDKITVEDQ